MSERLSPYRGNRHLRFDIRKIQRNVAGLAGAEARQLIIPALPSSTLDPYLLLRIHKLSYFTVYLSGSCTYQVIAGVYAENVGSICLSPLFCFTPLGTFVSIRRQL